MNWLAVALGGAIGSIARYGLSLLIVPQAGKFPWATLVANMIGCFLMGVFYGLIVARQIWPGEMRPWLMVGLLGGLTTFSSFALESVVLWHGGFNTTAISYAASSVLLNFLLVGVGYFLVEHYFLIK